jgi:NAD(P)-dependent dehydrogenase (short-subunit alcohol dehydrogenase family)
MGPSCSFAAHSFFGSTVMVDKERLLYDLEGKVALVTGAGGKEGLGRAIALRLAQEGADVVVNDIVGDGNVAERPGAPDWGGLPDVVREIEALGRGALGVVADVSHTGQVDRMVVQALGRFGHIDILVNNAGALAGRDRVPVVELEEDAWDLVQRVNVKGTFLCCRAVARAMIEQGQGGKIINISSVAGKRGMARFAAYCASKFAVRGFTQSLALELAPHRINVNAVCPGLIETERVDDMAAALAPAGVPKEAYRRQMVEQWTSGTPWGRIGQPADVAQVAAFLASAQSDYLTGVSITVAGGSHTD